LRAGVTIYTGFSFTISHSLSTIFEDSKALSVFFISPLFAFSSAHLLFSLATLIAFCTLLTEFP